MKKLIFPFVIFLLFLFSINTHASLSQNFFNLIPTPPKNEMKQLASLAKKSGAFGDYFRLKLAEQKTKASNIIGALKYANRVQDPVFSFWKTVVLAEISLAQNKQRQTLVYLKNLPSKPTHTVFFGEGLYETLFKRALIARYIAKEELRTNTKTEVAALLSLFPEDNDIENFISKENLKITLTSKQKIERLNNLYLKRQLNKIPGLITAVEIKKTKIPLEDKCQALYELGSALRTSKKHRDSSIAVFREIPNIGCRNNYLPRALYRLGYIKPSKKSLLPDTREQFLKQLYKNYPDHQLADDALYKLYKIAKENKDKKNAKIYYNKLMDLKQGDMKSELAFELAFPLFKKGKYSKSATYLSKALNNTTIDESYTKVLYWHARSLELDKNKGKAKKAYQKIINDYPYSFYALLAAKRINAKVGKKTIMALDATVPEHLADQNALIDEYIHNKFHTAAKIVLESVLYDHEELEKSNVEFLVQTLMNSQNYRKALDIVANHFDSGVYGPLQESENPLFSAFYPIVFHDKVKKAYELTSLPKGSIEGIMREESLFQTSVESHAGARGLLQLMPSTAALVKKSIDSMSLSSDITEPQTNIILGATYLAQMKTKFDESLPLAIMAYNAGPGNVRKWLKKNGNLELDLFIESIPFSETKGYVKRVLRSMHVYGDLYDNNYFANLEDLSFELPSNLVGKKKK